MHMITPLPGATPLKAGAGALPVLAPQDCVASSAPAGMHRTTPLPGATPLKAGRPSGCRVACWLVIVQPVLLPVLRRCAAPSCPPLRSLAALLWRDAGTSGSQLPCVVTPLAAITCPSNPTASLPFFGVEPALLDQAGNEIEGPGQG